MRLRPHHGDEGCTFCNELEGSSDCNFRYLFTVDEFPSRIIHQTEHFVAIPGLGPIGDAYVLILPIEPYSSMAVLPDHYYPELDKIKNRVVGALSKAYSPPIAFEHGPSLNKELAAGCCVEHGHIHLVSTPVDLLNDLQADMASGKLGSGTGLTAEKINSVQELKDWLERGIAYLYYQTREGDQWAFPVTKKLESQFLRKKLATTLGWTGESWDWFLYPNKEKVKATWQRLKEIMESE
jgi:diadenosine tetraphosphate (Ap4A) HIT family hydrolase